MEDLIIRPKHMLVTNKTVGGMWILLGLITIVIGRDSLDKSDWIRSALFCVIGALFLTPVVGSQKSKIEILDGGMRILWYTWIRKVTVQDTEIESIILAKNGVMIKRKDKKPLKIKLHLFEKDEKKKVFDFFSEYARYRNLVQV